MCCCSGHVPPGRRFAHRSGPLTFIREHCARAVVRLTIDLQMDRSAIAEPGALLEREQEVEHVGAVVRAVGRRAGAALVIEGVAGLGKSSLLDEARTRASELGFRVLSARAT